MAVSYNKESPFAKEAAKWEMDYSQFGPPGRPRAQIGHVPYPAMFYKMRRSETGGRIETAERREAADEAAANNLRSLGFYEGPAAAAAALEASEKEIAVLAANRVFNEQRMSPGARAEAAAADDATAEHLPSVPETPIQRRVARDR